MSDGEDKVGESAVAASAVDRLIERFGGIRPMAAKLDIPVTTVQGWKKRSAIPAARHNDIVGAAERHGISIDGIDLSAAEQPIADNPDVQTMRMPSTRGFFALAAGIFFAVALTLGFIGLYIVKQKTADLSHRVNMVEESLNQQHGSGDSLPAATVTDLQQRIADLNAQIAHVSALSQKVDDLQAANGSAGTLGQTVGGLQQTMAALQGNLQGLSQTMDGMRTHIGEIDATLAQKKSENARAFATLLAINQLREAAATSEPFDSEVTAAKSLAQGDPEIIKQLDILANYSTEGASTMNDLRSEFSDLAGEIVRSNAVGNGQSWLRQAWYKLGSVVSVRKIGVRATKSNSIETFVARAESRLEEDDLAGAVAALQGLDGLPKDVASAWVDSAQRRVAVDGALTALAESSLKQLSAFQSTNSAKP